MTAPRNARSVWLLYASTLLSAAPLGALVARQTPRPPGACSGIGWGCSLYGWDAAGFLLLIVGVPYAAVLGVVLAALAWIGSPGATRFAVVVAALGLAAPWAFVVTLFLA